MSRTALIAFCGLLLSVSAFSCDITLPAFFSMQRELGTSIELVQAVVPIFLMAQAIGQMAFGPVSDRFGRRPVIVGGLGLYLAGTVIALLAQSIGAVHVGRAAQGFGSACGIAVGRAVLRDISHGPALAQAMALAMAIFALGPISAPLVGYGLVALGGWRAIFLGMALFASCLLAFALLRFKETNEKPDPDALRPGRLLHSLGRIASNRQSRYFLLVAAATQFGIISFVSNAPRFFKSAFGIEGLQFALLFAATGLGIILGQIANNRVIAELGVLATTRVAALVLLVVTGLMVALSLAGRAAGVAVRVPDVLLQHQLPCRDGQCGEPGDRPAPRDRGLCLLGLRLLHADHGFGRGDPHRAALRRRAAALGAEHAGRDGGGVCGADGLPAGARGIAGGLSGLRRCNSGVVRACTLPTST